MRTPEDNALPYQRDGTSYVAIYDTRNLKYLKFEALFFFKQLFSNYFLLVTANHQRVARATLYHPGLRCARRNHAIDGGKNLYEKRVLENSTGCETREENRSRISHPSALHMEALVA